MFAQGAPSLDVRLPQPRRSKSHSSLNYSSLDASAPTLSSSGNPAHLSPFLEPVHFQQWTTRPAAYRVQSDSVIASHFGPAALVRLERAQSFDLLDGSLVEACYSQDLPSLALPAACNPMLLLQRSHSEQGSEGFRSRRASSIRNLLELSPAVPGLLDCASPSLEAQVPTLVETSRAAVLHAPSTEEQDSSATRPNLTPLAGRTPRSGGRSRTRRVPSPDSDSWDENERAPARKKSSGCIRTKKSSSDLRSAGKRQQRTIVKQLPFDFRNRDHVFIVHTQRSKSTAEVTHHNVKLLALTTSRDLPLVRAAYRNDAYTTNNEMQDRIGRHVYDFVEMTTGRTWTLTFDQNGSHLAPDTATQYNPSSFEYGATFDEDSDEVFVHTFVHFPPNSMVVSDEHPIGSKEWWKLQECTGNHGSKFPSGVWSAKFDDPAGEPRRPARVVGHFATCRHHVAEGDGHALGKLARAVRTPVK